MSNNWRNGWERVWPGDRERVAVEQYRREHGGLPWPRWPGPSEERLGWQDEDGPLCLAWSPVPWGRDRDAWRGHPVLVALGFDAGARRWRSVVALSAEDAGLL